MQTFFRKYRFMLFLGLLATLGLLTSCSTTKQAVLVSSKVLTVLGERPPVDEDLATLIPAGLQGASWTNVADLRTASLWPTLRAVLETHFDTNASTKSLFTQILNEADEVLSASGHRSKDEPDGFVTLAKGKWDTTKIMTAISRLQGAQTTGTGTQQVIQISGVTIFAITSQTVAISTPNLVDAVNALVNREGESLRNVRFFQSLQRPKSGGAVFRYRKGSAELDRRLFRGTPLASFKWISKVENAEATVEMDRSISVRAIGKMDSDASADKVKRDIERELRTITANPLIAMLGVKSLIEKLKIRTSNEKVRINLSLSRGDVDRILQLIEPLMQIRNMLEGN